MAGIEDILHNFTRLVGCHDIKDKQPIMDDLLASKGQFILVFDFLSLFFIVCFCPIVCHCVLLSLTLSYSHSVLLSLCAFIQCCPLFSGLSRQLSHGGSVSGSDRSPSIFPDHLPSISSSSSQPHLPQPSSDLLSSLPHASDQLVPDASCKDGTPHHSETDYEVLRLAISQLRAERQAQLQNLQQQQQQLESQADLSISPLKNFLSNAVHPGSGHTTPPLAQGGPTASAQLTQGRKAVSATLELIHSVLQPELTEEERREDVEVCPTERHTRRGHQDSSLVMVAGDTSTLLSNQNTWTNSTNDQRDTNSDRQGELIFSKAAQQDAASAPTTACPVAGDRSRLVKKKK